MKPYKVRGRLLTRFRYETLLAFLFSFDDYKPHEVFHMLGVDIE